MQIRRIIHWYGQVSVALIAGIFVKEGCLLIRLKDVVSNKTILEVGFTLTWWVCDRVGCGSFAIESFNA